MMRFEWANHVATELLVIRMGSEPARFRVYVVLTVIDSCFGRTGAVPVCHSLAVKSSSNKDIDVTHAVANMLD